MLLHRLAVRIKAQDWFAVCLEFLIVVVGVVLGFQITAWNEQRVDRALEAEYLQRIGDELSDNKAVLESIIRSADGNLLSAPDLTEFFDGRMAASDYQRLVVAIFEFGTNPLLGFDLTTFDDLVSTGRLRLISDPEVRQAVQRAYAGLERLVPLRDPYRDEYMAALYGWLSASVRQRIQAACPEYGVYAACSDLHLDEEAVRLIVERIDTREAQLVFQTREIRLGTLRGIGQGSLMALNEALTQLGR
jgi:hypothetical protein